MELIEEICNVISPYCSDLSAVGDQLYILLQDYSIEKKVTDLVEYSGDENQLLLQKYLVDCRIRGLATRTIDYYKNSLIFIFDRINKPCTQVTADDIRLYMAIRLQRDNVSKTTVGNEVRVLRAFYAWLVSEEIIVKNPMLKIGAPKKIKIQKEAFSDEEIAILRDSLRNSRERAVFEVLLSTGCRVSELVNIKNTDIDGDEVLVHGKGSKDRIVYLNGQAAYAIRKYQSERIDGSEWLFPGASFGTTMQAKKGWWLRSECIDANKHIDASSIESLIRALGRKHGIKAHPHKFRRTCATNALRSGMPIELVSKMLGHEQISTTQIYLDLNQDDMKNAHRKYVR